MDKVCLKEAIANMLKRVDATIDQPGAGFPHYADPADGIWTRSPKGDWTGGFWCGMLWLAALQTHDPKYQKEAREWALRLRERALSKSVFKGFLFWYGAGLGVEFFKDPVALDLSLKGTAGLIDMYNADARLIPLGSEAEEASDTGSNEANIDAIPGTVRLLLSGNAPQGAAEIGRSHLRQHIALCVRDDGSVCQSASFDGATGELRRRYTHKGFHSNSTWARAQAWCMLGLAQAIAQGENAFRDDAILVSDWWIANVPQDYVSFWDFDDPAIPDTNRDTSAAAIAAASLLKLARLIPEREKQYQEVAEATIERLVSGYLTPLDDKDPRQPGILVEGCFNKRNKVGTAHELIWGDYFLFEALLALEGTLLPESI